MIMCEQIILPVFYVHDKNKDRINILFFIAYILSLI